MPAGELTTRPLAEPVDVISLTMLVVSVYPPGARLKVAVQPMFALTVTTPSVQSALPDQPAKAEPAAAAAVRVTTLLAT